MNLLLTFDKQPSFTNSHNLHVSPSAMNHVNSNCCSILTLLR